MYFQEISLIKPVFPQQIPIPPFFVSEVLIVKIILELIL